ncbi:MAG: ParB/RepB/Spo0J family partition protein [Planctomycetales bacterium]|nr:ParB/RepB/Spo0J family partition protein [Planctomycetales bacterium]
MATTKSKLEVLEQNLDESIGERFQSSIRPRLSPVASRKDIGRRPLRSFGSIRVDQVIPDPHQPRTEFSDESILRLAQSIRKEGQFAPIRVRWSADHDKWIIVYGERRWRAVQAAQLETIDCHFDERELSATEILEQQMIENLLRDNLTPMEQAKGFSSLMELHGWNGKQLAESLHVTPSTVSRALALLDLPPEIQARVDAGEMAARSAYELTKLSDPQEQRELAGSIAGGMSLRETQAAVSAKRMLAKPKKAGRPRTKRLEFRAENGWRIVATPPSDGSNRTYDDLREAIDHVVEDVESRIRANIRID